MASQSDDKAAERDLHLQKDFEELNAWIFLQFDWSGRKMAYTEYTFGPSVCSSQVGLFV